MTLHFHVPLPPRMCSSNGSHGSWPLKARATRDYRHEGYGYALEALREQSDAIEAPNRVRMSLAFCTRGVRLVGRYAPRDVSNALAAFKGCQDGFTDAGVWVDDSSRHLELGSVTIVNTRGPWVEVEIEEVP